jgi:beta-glucosidase
MSPRDGCCAPLPAQGAFENPDIRPEQAIDRPAHRALIRRAAAEGMVLLKNQGGILPLNLASLSSIAIIGPNAKTAQIMGGGSAQVNAHYAISPYDGIAARVGNRATLGYEIGCTNHRQLPRLDGKLVEAGDGSGRGFTIVYYNSPDLTGDPVHRATVETGEQVWLGEVAARRRSTPVLGAPYRALHTDRKRHPHVQSDQRRREPPVCK